jgi:hypothetical protein
MQIDITPETERLIREEISNGQVHTVDEIIKAGVEILRERRAPSIGTSPLDAKNLVDLFANSPFRGLNINFNRDRDYGRDVEL